MKKHPYYKKVCAFATMHEKEKAIKDLLFQTLRAEIVVPSVNTDALGTFCGRVTRQDTPLETAKKKAMQGIEVSGLSVAFASEGSFVTGPFGFGVVNHEILVLVDAHKDMLITETLSSYKTNYDRIEIGVADLESVRLKEFLKKCQFGTHGLIVSSSVAQGAGIVKGITDYQQLCAAITLIAHESGHARVIIETDMRAHLNPTRMQNIHELSKKMVLRLATLCAECGTPGFGCTQVVPGLPCMVCDAPTDGIKHEVHSCAKCGYTQLCLPAVNPRYFASPAECSICNP